MKAAELKTYGGTESILFNKNAPAPKVQPGKVVVEVYAAGVNPFDWKVRAGFMKQTMPLRFPVVLGGDFSGVVSEVGAGVTDYKVGDAVYGQASIFNGGSGALAEYDLAPVKAIARKPKNLNHLEAAAIPLTGVSAIQALVEHANLQSGQKILIHGGAGGIGTIAIQLAKHLAAYVATTVSADDVDYVKKLGADEAIDYKKEKFEESLSGFDAVYDTVGGETYAGSFKILKPGGVIVSMLEKEDRELMEQYGVKAISQFTQVTNARLNKLSELVESGVIKVHIDKIFPLSEAAEALTYLQQGHPRGKVVANVHA